jgi:aminoglycoside phosphotransferase (APT) family kinase protein
LGTGRAGLDRATAEDVLAKACAMASLEPTGAELVRLGSAAVFRLRTQRVIARIGRNGSLEAVADREVRVSRWLADAGVPASRALQVEQPLKVGDHVVTLWESAADEERYGSTVDLARLLRQLHALAPPTDPCLPQLDPVGRAFERIDNSAVLSDSDREFLRARLEGLNAAYRDLDFALPPGVIHGDASVGNVILDGAGAPLFVDLDGVAVGPREWDLVLTAIYYDRFGWHTAPEYAAFVDVVGFDITSWPGYNVLGDLRESLMVVWLAHTADSETKTLEVAKRLVTLRTTASRRDWSPF